jgi:hypothetical protein
MSALHSQRPVEPTGLWLTRYGTGALRWCTRRLAAGRAPAPRFDIWAGLAPGGPLYTVATGLGRDAAFALAGRCRAKRPEARVVVLDAAGDVVG